MAWRSRANASGGLPPRPQTAGARTGVVLVPARFQVDDENYDSLKAIVAESGENLLRDAATDRFASALSGLGLPMVDTLPALRAASGEARVFMRSTAHFTPHGHDVVAARAGRLPPRQRPPGRGRPLMVFNSLYFVAFFLVVYALYRALPHRAQNWLLLAASYTFYASWDWRFVGLLAASTLAAYACGVLLGRFQDDRRRAAVLLAGLGFHLAVLGFFKYFNFFAENLQALLGLAGWRVDGFTLRVLLPVGISFYTFVAMSYVIDVYRRQTEPCRNLVDVAAFIGFFPTLLAGPIVRASSLLRQIRAPRPVRADQVRRGRRG